MSRLVLLNAFNVSRKFGLRQLKSVYKNIWNFDDSKVLFRIWYLPIEEYAFFILESINVMLLTVYLIERKKKSLSREVENV